MLLQHSFCHCNVLKCSSLCRSECWRGTKGRQKEITHPGHYRADVIASVSWCYMKNTEAETQNRLLAVNGSRESSIFFTWLKVDQTLTFVFLHHRCLLVSQQRWSVLLMCSRTLFLLLIKAHNKHVNLTCHCLRAALQGSRPAPFFSNCSVSVSAADTLCI